MARTLALSWGSCVPDPGGLSGGGGVAQGHQDVVRRLVEEVLLAVVPAVAPPRAGGVS